MHSYCTTETRIYTISWLTSSVISDQSSFCNSGSCKFYGRHNLKTSELMKHKNFKTHLAYVSCHEYGLNWFQYIGSDKHLRLWKQVRKYTEVSTHAHSRTYSNIFHLSLILIINNVWRFTLSALYQMYNGSHTNKHSLPLSYKTNKPSLW